MTPRIVSFEPSEKACRCLLANLAATGTSFVNTYQSTIDRSSEGRTFFEPTDHLTNGSFVRSLFELFSSEIVESAVVTLAVSKLDHWLNAAGGRSLFKIDVEGFELQRLEMLRASIEKYRPDLDIEVLPLTAQALNECESISGHDRYLISMEGLQRCTDSSRAALWPASRRRAVAIAGREERLVAMNSNMSRHPRCPCLDRGRQHEKLVARRVA